MSRAAIASPPQAPPAAGECRQVPPSKVGVPQWHGLEGIAGLLPGQIENTSLPMALASATLKDDDRVAEAAFAPA